MWQGALALIPSFVLTVLIGGAYASFLQQRSWKHQNQTRLNEEERKQGSDIRTALSEVLDKRRYRTVRLLQAIGDRARDKGSDDELRDRHSEYEQALADWNDQLTTRLVSVEVYFGRDVRDRLEGIDEHFRLADGEVKKLYWQLVVAPDGAASIDDADVEATEKRLDALREQSYALGLTMMLHLRRGDVAGTTRHQQWPPRSLEPSVGALAAGNAALTPTSQRSSSQHPAAITAPWRQGPSIAISVSGLIWIICLSMPVWSWSYGGLSGWELLTQPENWSGGDWAAWLPTLATLAIAASAAATLAERWSRYRALVPRCAIAVGALSVIVLVTLGLQANDSYHSVCGSNAASWCAGQGLGVGYYLGIATAVLTAGGGLWGTVQSQRRRA